MKSGLFCLLFFTVHITFAQVFTVKEVRDTVFMFPVIESSQRPDVARKINSVIGGEWNFDAEARNPFENFTEVMEENFSYQVITSNERIISMELESSYASCGLHITRSDYNFDSRTGVAIDLNKALGANGMTKLKTALAKTWKAALRSAAADTSDYHWKEYRDCLNAAKETTQTDPDARIQFLEQGIRFWVNGCLEGTAYEFEADKAHGPHVYSFGQLLPMLSPYGYSLFVNSAAGPIKSLMRGTIDGKYPISLTLFQATEGDGITGMIVYDRVGVPIDVKGTMNGNQIIFNELDDLKNPISNIELIWDGTKLTGSFTNLRSKKQMPFVASVVK